MAAMLQEVIITSASCLPAPSRDFAGSKDGWPEAEDPSRRICCLPATLLHPELLHRGGPSWVIRSV
jgi:hypothetical protein